MPGRRTILCLASYFKGERFLQRCREENCHVILLTAQSLLGEPWPRAFIDELYGLPNFQDVRAMLNTVSFLARTRKIDRVVALDDFDVEIGANIREHLRMPGLGDSPARLYRDKLAMRVRARAVGVRIPDFTGIFNHDEVRAFLARVPAPWMLKPRSEASAIGIHKLHNADDVWRAIDGLGDNQSFHLLEQMVPGDLYHVDSITSDGKVAFSRPSRYRRPLFDVYHGGGVYATQTLPTNHPDFAPLVEVNRQLLTGFGYDRGASHTEFMKAHADGQFYFIETSCRVGGANTAEMVEAATGINLWSEWAKVEIDFDVPYVVPAQRNRHAGVILSLAKVEKPDTSAYTDPEIIERIDKKNHVGFVLAADDPAVLDRRLDEYVRRISEDFLAVVPASGRPVN
ncbi:MAG: ATPase [Gemmataceae bacterium]|nr:ATPase [Gemmataceae bacterium]